MKFKLLPLLGFSFFSIQLIAQEFNPQNAREGENVEYCITHKKLEALLNDPVYAQQVMNAQLTLEQEQLSGNDAPKATTYYIPVVFHLLHNNGVENISDDQILDALDILNRDYDLQNADANAVVNAFNASNPSATSIPTDVDIQFRLATIAPDGTCFNGITRTVSSQTSSGDGQDQVAAVVSGNDVYQGVWPHTKYLNIIICEDIGGAAGYTFNPFTGTQATQTNMYFNSVFVLHSYVGSIGTSSASSSRTLTHEVGHWLNLSHPWGDTNDPGVSCGNDNVSDTPQTIGATACTLTANTCTGDNSYWGFNQIDQVENYMDYSYCSKMFSPGQVTRMRTAATSGTSGRSTLISAGNLTAVGAEGVMTLCRAEFEASKTTLCAGESITFTDQTFNAVSGWNWTFSGGTPSSSTDQNPVITYSTPGVYDVTLQATDPSGNDTETKTDYIVVLPSGASIPFYESFENFTTLNGTTEWTVYNPSGEGFEITTTAGHTGSKSAKLANFNQSTGNVDVIESSTVDLSGVSAATGVTLSFRYAYRQRNSSNDEWLKVFVTSDCGDSWVQRKTIHGTQLSDQVATSTWTPGSQSDWTTVHMTNVTSSYWVDDFRYKFSFESDGGNNFYLDDINIYASDPSDAIVVGLNDLSGFEDLSIYPNPTENDLNVSFSLENSEVMQFVVTDLSGKKLQANTVHANSGSNLVLIDTEAFAGGVYMLSISAGDKVRTLQFVVK